jgi:hypothetical protein
MLQSLLLTGLGGVLRIAGTLLATQWQTRVARHIRQEQYSREDRYRLATERIRAYSSFYQAAGKARSSMGVYTKTAGQDVSLEEVMDARNALWDAYTVIALIGDDDTAARASAVVEFVADVAEGQSPFVPSRWSELIRDYVRTSRLELVFAANSNRSSSSREMQNQGIIPQAKQTAPD